MEKFKKFLFNFVIPVLIIAAVVALIMWVYDSNMYFRSLFTGENSPAVLGSTSQGATETLADKIQLAGRIAMYICSGIIALQICCFYMGFRVIRNIDRKTTLPEIKLKKFKNAGTLMDLPLYVGLFGTVSSFLIISYSPSSGKLIAYSSTLVGIIATMVLRTLVLYPAQNRIIAAEEAELKKQK